MIRERTYARIVKYFLSVKQFYKSALTKLSWTDSVDSFNIGEPIPSVAAKNPINPIQTRRNLANLTFVIIPIHFCISVTAITATR